MAPRVPFCSGLLLAQRFDSTTAEDTESATSNRERARQEEQATLEHEQFVIKMCKWQSNVMEERLGFSTAETYRSQEQLKENFFILAKHFHPDNPEAPPEATLAFQSIKEAYDILSKQAKEKGSASHTSSADDEFYSDHARRRGFTRVLGDGVFFFMIMTVVFIGLVVTHNKGRLRPGYLWSLLGIFFTIQLFPRLLAVAVLYAAHVTSLVQTAKLTEQAAVMLVVERLSSGLCLHVDGVSPDAVPALVLQVETTLCVDQEAERLLPPSEAHVASANLSTTLTFDAGVTTVTLPMPPKGKEKNVTYHITAVDESRKLIVLDKTFKLSF